jgi:hypothetical protein
MIGPKIVSTVLSLPLILAFFWHGESHESKLRSVARMDAHNSSVALGMWGGPHISIEVTGQGARLDYDCAHGTIDHKLMTDRTGHFKASGLHFKEHGGPIRADETEQGEPASYTGKTNGQTMTLTVTLTKTHEKVGTYTLTHGKSGRIMKCK